MDCLADRQSVVDGIWAERRLANRCVVDEGEEQSSRSLVKGWREIGGRGGRWQDDNGPGRLGCRSGNGNKEDSSLQIGYADRSGRAVGRGMEDAIDSCRV